MGSIPGGLQIFVVLAFLLAGAAFCFRNVTWRPFSRDLSNILWAIAGFILLAVAVVIFVLWAAAKAA